MKNNNVDTSLLEKYFWDKAQQMIQALEDDGYQIRIVSGVRTPTEQARIWRQGRSTNEIQSKIHHLRKTGSNAIADLLESVGVQKGSSIISNALPGYSWHNWREAIDVWVNDDPEGKEENYKPLALMARKFSLTPGWDFTRRDPGHIQFNPFEITQRYSLNQINDYVKNNP